MKNDKTITDLLKKSYFWDLEITPGAPVPERLVVERVFSYGTLGEAALVVKYFGRKKIEKILLNLNYLDPKTLNFVSKIFNIPVKKFRCYSRKQLRLQYWDY